jgi:hypothetical protein
MNNIKDRSATDAALRIALDEENGNLQLAARRLGVTDRTADAAGCSAQSRRRLTGIELRMTVACVGRPRHIFCKRAIRR